MQDPLTLNDKSFQFAANADDIPVGKTLALEFDGRHVLLCWRSDEESVTWYHTPEDGYSGRTPIPEVLLREDAL